MTRTRPAHRRRVVAALALAALGPFANAPVADAAAKRPSARLSAFGSCQALLDYARANARRFPGTVDVRFPTPAPTARPEGDAVATPQPAAAPEQFRPATDDPTAGVDFSTTNTQEADVDEPDVVKTDGRRIYTASNGVLRVLVLRDGRPEVVGSLPLDGYGHELLLRDDRLLVLGRRFVADAAPSPGATPRLSIAYPAGREEALLLDVDVRDARAPVVRRELAMDGRLLTARATGGTARVVVTTPPRPVDVPAPTGDAAQIEAARDAAVTAAPLTTYRPTLRDRRRGSSATRTRGAVPCRQIRRPRTFSGLDTTTVLTIDLDRGLPEVEADAVVGGADTVYASTTGLYLATTRWDATLDATGVPSRATTTTHLHRFRTGTEERTTYRASGAVPGYVLNSYALSEHRGVLRVATTTDPLSEGGVDTPSSSAVTVLDERDGRLVPVGRVGDLGIDERIFGVRFIGDVGYVVTFRQTDPLYTIDLADPRAPRVLGELKILGFSAYLHPIGDDLLLGVGQDATEQGRRLGTQVSVFDVSDLRRPRVVRQARVGGNASSSVEFDPRAFLWWAPSRLAVLPVSAPGGIAFRQETAPGVAPSPAPRPPSGFSGAIGFRVPRDGAITEAGRVSDPSSDGFAPPITRTIVVAGRLVTVSDTGVGTARLSDLGRVGFARYAPASPAG